MQLIKQIKTDAGESVLIFLVPDVAMQSVADFFDRLKQDYFVGNPPFDTPLTTAPLNIEEPILDEGKDTPGSIINAFKNAARIGPQMTDSQKRRSIELLGKERAEFLFSPTWGDAAFALVKMIDKEKLERDIVNGVTKGWKHLPNPDFKPNILSAILSTDHPQPGQLDTTPAKVDVVTDEFMTNEELHDKLIELSTQGKELSPAMVGVIDRTLKGASRVFFPGGKNGGMDLFMKLLNNQRREDPRDFKSKWVDNEHFSPSFMAYAKTRV